MQYPEGINKKLPNGHRARQRDPVEIALRSAPFDDACRMYGIPGMDVDKLIVFPKPGTIDLRLVMEATSWVYLPREWQKQFAQGKLNLLHCIEDRRPTSDALFAEVANRLRVPAQLVVFGPDVATNRDSPVFYRSIPSDCTWNWETAGKFFASIKREYTEC